VAAVSVATIAAGVPVFLLRNKAAASRV